MCDSPRTGYARRTTPIYTWHEQAMIVLSRRVISIACCHSVKLRALAARAFQSQHCNSACQAFVCCTCTAILPFKCLYMLYMYCTFANQAFVYVVHVLPFCHSSVCICCTIGVRGGILLGGRKKIVLKITICPKNKEIALKLTFLV